MKDGEQAIEKDRLINEIIIAFCWEHNTREGGVYVVSKYVLLDLVLAKKIDRAAIGLPLWDPHQEQKLLSLSYLTFTYQRFGPKLPISPN